MFLEMGGPLGELLEQCGGMRDGRRLAAIVPGGASSNFLPPDRLDVPGVRGDALRAGRLVRCRLPAE